MGLDYSDARPPYFNLLNRAGLDYSDVRPSYINLLNLELCVESRIVDMAGIFENSWREAAAEADAIGEQQLCTESYPAPDYSCRRTRGNDYFSR